MVHRHKRSRVKRKNPNMLTSESLKKYVTDIASGKQLGWPQVQLFDGSDDEYYTILTHTSRNHFSKAIKCSQCKGDLTIAPAPVMICLDERLEDVGSAIVGWCRQCGKSYPVILPGRIADLSLTSFSQKADEVASEY